MVNCGSTYHVYKNMTQRTWFVSITEKGGDSRSLSFLQKFAIPARQWAILISTLLHQVEPGAGYFNYF